MKLWKRRGGLNQERENDMELESRKDMGMAELSQSIFARKFRWTLKNANFSECFVKSVKVDHVKKVLDVEFYDVVLDNANRFNALNWLTNLQSEAMKGINETLLLTTYDGCGNPLYGIKFTGLTLLEHTMDLDYSDSDVIYRKTKLSFLQQDLEIHNPKKPTVTPFDIKASEFNDRMLKYLSKHSVEENEVNFLNGKMNIPGRMTEKKKCSPKSSCCTASPNYHTYQTKYFKGTTEL